MAEGYGSNAGAVAYHTARGRSLADYEDDELTAARLVGSEALDARYRGMFPGTKVGLRAQVREWPRVAATDRDGYSIPSDSVPMEVENASYELMYRQLTSPGSLTRDYSPSKYKRVAVDGAVNVEYKTFDSASEFQTQFTVVDQIIAPVLTAIGADFSGLSGAAARV